MVQVQRILATCGNGHLGRLGHGIGQESSKFLRIVGSLVGYEVEQVACGGAHTAVVTDDGSLFTFGQNDWGQLGHSAGDKYIAVPIEVTLPDPVVSVAAGEQHTLCLTKADECGWMRSSLPSEFSPSQASHIYKDFLCECPGVGFREA